MKRILILFILLINEVSFSQAPILTFADTSFKVCDVIRAPKVPFYSCCYGCPDGWVPSDVEDSLKLIAAFIKKYPTLVFQIEQHTDQRGEAKRNKQLSEDRATSIRRYLVEKLMVDSTRVVCKGLGGSSPLYTTVDIQKSKTKEEKEELYAQNRRTELRVIANTNDSRSSTVYSPTNCIEPRIKDSEKTKDYPKKN